MEKKVNLTIFFNYRNYSPRFKLLLEDVFYKKMHDEKLTSSSLMQEVMQFCSDVDNIEYSALEDDRILSRFDKASKKILINNVSISKLLDEHKDLDEEALLKNIFAKQVQNTLYISEDKVFDVTFEDILNKNGYVTPRRLTEIKEDGESISSESTINEIIGAKYIGNKEDKNENPLFDKDESKNNGDSTFNFKGNSSFASFEDLDSSIYDSKQPSIKRYADIDDDYDVVDCVRRKDGELNGTSFSDFVSKSKSDVDYTLEDEENYGDLKKHKKSNKKGNGLFSGMKSKMSSIKEKMKGFRKKEDDEYLDEFEDETEHLDRNVTPEIDTFRDFNYLDEKEKASNLVESDVKIYEKENKEETSEYSNSASIVDNFKYEKEIEVDNKFDSIIEAIMKEKREKEYGIDKTSISYSEKAEKSAQIDYNENFDNLDDISYNESESNLEDVTNKDKHSSIYDTFAEELETVESIRRRRRK